MASTHRPGTVQVGEEADYGTTSGAALRADAEALLTCYGVGEGDPAPPLVREEGWAWSQARGATRAGGSQASGSTSTDSASLSSYDEGHTEVQALPVSAAGVGVGSDSGAVGGAAGQGTTLATSSFEQDPFYIERGPPHTVCELAFTSSVRFLQPGLLLQVSVASRAMPHSLCVPSARCHSRSTTSLVTAASRCRLVHLSVIYLALLHQLPVGLSALDAEH